MKLNKRLIVLGIIFVVAAIVGKLLFVAVKSIKVDDFHKSAVIFVVDSSASNQNMLPAETKYLKTLCSILDPEDEIKILKVSEKSYLIYEGSPSDSQGITKAIEAFTKYDEKDYGTAYGEGIKKAFEHALTMKKEGFVPAVVVIGDLENEGDIAKQINWDTLPDNVKSVQQYIPELSMMFVFAHPEKLDLVKTKLNPVLGEKKLIVANEQNAQKAQRRFLEAIGR
ncbi:MAG: VWA domain-containing protein [Candidatus Gastranaerophilales bacterium]|nr:VWA domain-containing protein [Candidatus Gastranaerophilales bacterium]